MLSAKAPLTCSVLEQMGPRACSPFALMQRRTLAKEVAVMQAVAGPSIVPLLATVTVPAIGGGEAFAGYVMPVAASGDVFDIVDEHIER